MLKLRNMIKTLTKLSLSHDQIRLLKVQRACTVLDPEANDTVLERLEASPDSEEVEE